MYKRQRCGKECEAREGGHMRQCINPDCKTQHFPRTDPAVIMLVHHGNKTLLGRQRIWPEGMYSTLAGFVEPGETLENAVAREVFEEAGIKANVEKVIGFRHSANLNGLSSPNLYVVFRLKHLSGEPRFDGEETIDAGYFSMSEIGNKQGIQTLSLWAIKLAFSSDRNMGFVSQDSFFEPRAGRTVFGIES